MSKFTLKSRHYIESPDQKKHFNRELFSAIAKEYSGMSRILSFGRDLAWKRKMIDSLPELDSPLCLDLASGPGDLTALLRERYENALVTCVDLTASMLELAKQRFSNDESVDFLERDLCATKLPGADFDLITVGYGIRNAPQLECALEEINRLLKPGGYVAILDFSRWDPVWLSNFEILLLRIWCGMWGLVSSGNADTYAYIADSLSRFPTRRKLHALLEEKGFQISATRRYFLGVIETVIAVKGYRQ